MISEIVNITRSDDGLSIWIDSDQKFNHNDFIAVVASLKIHKKVRVLESFGPAEIIDDYYTSKGKFSMSIEFDEDPGMLIYCDDPALMDEIYLLMISSKKYQEYGNDDN